MHRIGDRARCSVEFCQKSSKSISVLGTDELGELAFSIEQLHCRQWNENLTRSDMINLVAFSTCGRSVFPGELSSVPIIGSSPQQLTWQQLADRGLINLLSHRMEWFVRIPFTVIRACSSKPIDVDASPVKVAFLKTLKILVELPLTPLESWQKWELFGAHFHCLRINSLLILDITSCPFSTFCPNANTDIEVILRPAYVFRAAEELSAETDLRNITEMGNILRSVNLLDKECKKCYVILNCPNGKAADIYFALQESDSERFVLFTDQRKRDCIALTTRVIKDYHNRMTALRRPDPNLVLITGLFSPLIGYGKRPVKKPVNSVVLSKEELHKYHCSFANHPSASTLIDVHLCKKSLLTAILGIELSNHIKRLTNLTTFRTFDSLNRALCASYKCEIEEKFRNLLFFMTRENADVHQDIIPSCDDDENDDEIFLT